MNGRRAVGEAAWAEWVAELGGGFLKRKLEGARMAGGVSPGGCWAGWNGTQLMAVERKARGEAHPYGYPATYRARCSHGIGAMGAGCGAGSG